MTKPLAIDKLLYTPLEGDTAGLAQVGMRRPRV
jgi:hypothetical protein